MLRGPDYYYCCPKCSAVASRTSIVSGNTFGAVYWSDAKREAPMLPDAPALVACPSCRTYLWIALLTSVGKIDCYNAPPDNGELPARWENAPRFRNPDGNDFAEALTAGLADTAEHERYIRVRIWWSLNDQHRKGDRTNRGHDTSFLSNLNRLATLLDDTANDTLLRAEIARESGCFAQTVELCDTLFGVNPERHLIDTAALIRARAIAKDQWVFRC